MIIFVTVKKLIFVMKHVDYLMIPEILVYCFIDHISPVETEIGTELGNKLSLSLATVVQSPKLVQKLSMTDQLDP